MPSNVATLPMSARKQAASLLRRARCAAGMSQERAAQLASLSPRAYGDMERGRVPMRALEALVLLEQAANDTKRAA